MVYIPIVPFMHDDEENIDLSLGSAIVDATEKTARCTNKMIKLIGYT